MINMIRFEFKKLLIKQYGLILIIILVIAKIISSSELFEPDYGSLTPQQREVYIGYIKELGGVLTDEKESAIIETYTSLLEAESKLSEIEKKRNNGEFADMEEYFKALSQVPEIISHKAAIEKLYSSYKSVAEDRENRVLLAFDAPAMRVGQEYLFLIFICYISAASVYYERRINNLQKTSVNGKKGCCAKLLALLSVIGFVWVIFALIEFFALTAVVSGNDLKASLASLESFKETSYSDMTVIGGFCAVQGVKLIGYLFTAAITLILIRFSGNLILSVFSPAALNIVWIYLFGNNTVAFYQPFSLMRSAFYFTGTHYIDLGTSCYPEYDEIPLSVLLVLIAVSAAVIVFAGITVANLGKNHLGRKTLKLSAAAMITMLAMLLGGCSGISSDQAAHGFGSAENIAKKDDEFFALRYVTNSEHRVLSSKISVLNDDLDVKRDNILRNIFETEIVIDGIFVNGDYLYYSAVFEDSSRINRINLEDFSEETLYFGDYAIFRGQTKYFDMITVWSDGLDMEDVTVKDFFADNGKIVILMKSGKVYSLDISTGFISYLFEDVVVHDFCTMEGKIYYLNLNGELICFEGGKKEPVSSRIFTGLCSDEKNIYVCGPGGVYRYDGEFGETQLSSTKGNGRIRAWDGNTAFETEKGWSYIENGTEKSIGGADDIFICGKGLILDKNDDLILYERWDQNEKIG